MRIPSQFNQDSLYRRDNRQRDSAREYRRLIRLALGLAIVVVVMRQASRPAMYQTFFDPSSTAETGGLGNGDPGIGDPGIGDPGTGDPGSGDRPDPPQGAVGRRIQFAGSPASETKGEIGITAVDRTIANQIVAELLPSDQRLWMVALSQWQEGRPVQLVPSSIESLSSTLASMDSISEQQRTNWQRMLQSVSAASGRSDGNDVANSPGEQGAPEGSLSPANPSGDEPSTHQPSANERPQVMAMLAALDNAASSRVEDGSVWRAGDFDSLYRFLDQAKRLPQGPVAATGVIPLLQQPDVFRNQWVRIAGTVARTERMEAQENPWGSTHYWQLWLRPIDGADRPMVAIVPNVPESVGSIGATSTKLEGPEIVVVGKYLKRLAYQSGVGADLAPVVVGQITKAPISEDELARRSNAEAPDQSHSIWLPILLACLLGVASAVLVMWRSAAAANRARELRASNREPPDAFLQDLSHLDQHRLPSNEDRS